MYSILLTCLYLLNICCQLPDMFLPNVLFMRRGVELLWLVVLNKAPSKWERRLKYWD